MRFAVLDADLLRGGKHSLMVSLRTRTIPPPAVPVLMPARRYRRLLRRWAASLWNWIG